MDSGLLVPTAIPGSNAAPSTEHLARLLESDILRRGLREGDRYLTNKQAAELLDVSEVSAHRAMRVLADRQKIVRRRRAGTFVGPHANPTTPVKLRCVHMLIPYRLRSDYPVAAVIDGLRSEMPGVQVQLNFPPETDPLPFLRDLVDHVKHSEVLAGIVAGSVTNEARRFFQGSDLPVVVGGHTEASIDLPWVDRDQRRIGRLLSQYLVDRGHRRIAMIMREQWAPGDNLVAEGIDRVVAGAKAELAVRSVLVKEELTAAVIRDLLRSPARPTGLICRSEQHAVWCAQTAEAIGLSVPGDVEIVTCMQTDVTMRTKYRFPHASFDPVAFGAAVGRLLSRWEHGKRPDPDHYEIPVTLVEPRPSD